MSAKYPLSQVMLTGYSWAMDHDIKHNHDSLFYWTDENQQPSLYSACAIGFGWIGCAILAGVPDTDVLTEVWSLHDSGKEEERFIDIKYEASPDPDAGDERFGFLCPAGCGGEHSSLGSMVVHLNDGHNWTIPMIVQYVQAIEPDEISIEIPAQPLVLTDISVVGIAE